MLSLFDKKFDINQLRQPLADSIKALVTAAKWAFFAWLTGVLVGMVGIIFHKGLDFVTAARTAHSWLILLLPVGGLLIAGLYHLFRNTKDTGTNLVLSAIHSGAEIPLRMAPLIFISTLVTHLCGGSAGREGAALL